LPSIIWMKKEAHVQVTCAFTDDLLDPFTVTPPVRSIVLRVRNRNDSNLRLVAKRLLEKQPAAARVHTLREHIDAPNGQTIRATMIAQSQGSTVGAVALAHKRRNHLHLFSRNSRLFETAR